MTQAFNLSQLANKVNTSGQLDVSTGITGTISSSNLPTITADKGGTGQTSLTANNVILGNGTSAVQFVAPSTNGNVLTSNGTTWTSSAINAGGVTTLVNNVTVGTGTSVTYSGLTLTSYKFLIITFNGVAQSSSKSGLAITSTGDQAHSLTWTTKFGTLYGSATLDLSTGYITGILYSENASGGGYNLSSNATSSPQVWIGSIATGYSTATTSITFTLWNGTSTLSGGTIGIYGLK